MNGHAANQFHPFGNTSQQTQAGILLNGITTQHNSILEHVSRVINDNFRVLHERFNGFYDMSHKQYIAQNVEQRRIVNELSEIRARTETLSTALNSLSGQMQQLENGQDAISTSLKRLNGGMGQLDDRLGSLKDKANQIDLNVQEIAEFVKDPKAFTSSSPSRRGTASPLRAQAAHNSMMSSIKSPQTLSNANAGPPRPTLHHDIIQSNGFDHFFPTSESYVFGQPAEIFESISSQTVPLSESVTAAVMNGTLPFIEGDAPPVSSIQYRTVTPSKTFQRSKRSRGGRKLDHSPSSMLPGESVQDVSLLSSLLDSDLSDPSDTDDKTSLQINSTPRTRVRKSRRLVDSVKKQSQALVLYDRKKPQGKSQPSPTHSRPIKKQAYKRKRKYGTQVPRKSAIGQVALKGAEIAPVIPFPMDDVELIGCDSCDRWYHNTCVGLSPLDLASLDDAPYICPACSPQGTSQFAVVDRVDANCSAQDCTIPLECFFVDELLGRKPCPAGPPGQFSWLLKWTGWDIDACSWKPETLFPAPPLIQKFYAAAKAEGMNVEQLMQPPLNEEIVLLAEARSFMGVWEDNYA